MNNHGSYLAATGNANFGYFGGGSYPSHNSFISRIDYSNDTATAAAKGPLSVIRKYHAATGNSSFGYFGGGSAPSTSSTVDRLDYDNDTTTASPKGDLSAARIALGAASARANGITTNTLFPASSVRENVAPQGTDFGYVGGGYPIQVLYHQ